MLRGPESSVLLVFVKEPSPGMVKTRLARDVGKEEAARLYRAIASAVWSRTRGGFVRWVVFDPPEAGGHIRRWLPGASRYLAQTCGDLGERLRAAFRCAFSQGATRVLAVGTDVPEIDGERLERAFGLLREHPAVLGPSHDGGYWLLGLSRLEPRVFGGVRWSSSETLRDTLQNLRALGMEPALMETLRDIDTAEDLRAPVPSEEKIA